MFYLEFRKFLRVYNSFFYNNRLVTIFNSCEIRLEKKDLELMFNLYLYAAGKKLVYYKYIIQDFLYTYNNTINSKEYMINRVDYRESKKDFSEVIDNMGVREKLYIETPNDLYVFYKEIIYYGLKNDVFIDGENICRFFNNLKFSGINYDELIELFITNKKNIYSIIKFDCKKSRHIDVYIEYISDSLDTFGGYNYAKEIIFELDKSGCLTEELNKLIINMYVSITNILVDKLKNKQYSFIHGLSELESLRKELVFLIKNIESYSDSQKIKIKDCLSRILSLKRYLISDDNYVKSEMHESVHEHKMPKKEVEAYVNSVFSNIDRTINFENINIEPMQFIHNSYNDSIQFIRTNTGVEFGQEEYLKQFVIDDKTNEQRDFINMNKYIINKLRNSVAHFRFKALKGQGNSVVEDKIYLYDEYNDGTKNFNIVMSLNDLVNIARTVEIEMKQNASKNQCQVH